MTTKQIQKFQRINVTISNIRWIYVITFFAAIHLNFRANTFSLNTHDIIARSLLITISIATYFYITQWRCPGCKTGLFMEFYPTHCPNCKAKIGLEPEDYQ